jgi:AcrR family transcriptional regulator
MVNSGLKSVDRKQKILSTALILMNEQGVESVSMDEIARKAGISKGALYLEFESKIDLIITLSSEFSERLNRQFSQALASRRTGLEILKEYGAIYLRFVHQNPLFMATLTAYQRALMDGKLENLHSANICKELEHDAMTLVVRAAQIGIQDGSIVSKVEPSTLGLLIFAGFKGLTDLYQVTSVIPGQERVEDLKTFEEVMSIFMEIMERGISA